MAGNKRESFDIFAIPKNFSEDGVSFNGISRRNLAEGILLAAASGYPILMHLPFSLSVRVVLLCFIPLPLFFFGLVGIGGESLTQFVVTFFRWLLRRRTIRYYIDRGEPEQQKLKGMARIKAVFKKHDKDEVQYIKARRSILKRLSALFDELFSAKKIAEEEPASKSRQIKNQAQAFIPVEDIRGGMLITRDKRYIKIVEILPINFLLRSADEQRDIILSFAELLRIAPVKLQFKSNANRADIGKFLARVQEDMEREENQSCRETDEDYIKHIQETATQNAMSRRFFVIFEYENPFPAHNPSEADIRFALESAVTTIRSYLSRCGNQIAEFENEADENEFLLGVFDSLMGHYNTNGITLDDKISRAFKWRLEGKNTSEMCTADYISPDSIDLRAGKYIVVDGVYHSYLYIPSGGFKTLVGAAWLSPLVNAGEAIDVDLFLHKLPADRMQQQVSRNLRLNKAKISEVSSTSVDYNKLGDIMESGYYLQRGLNDGQEFFYANVLITIKAFSKKDLENRVSEVQKLMTAKQIMLRTCSYMQEAAFVSTLPLARLDPKLYKLGRRNMLTNTAASTYMFTAFEICDDKGVLVGTNDHNNSLVILDLFNSRKYKNPHMTIMGTSGSGKSFTLQILATRLRRKHVHTYIIAPIKGHEFIRSTRSVGGQFIRLSPGSKHCINIMEIRPVDNRAAIMIDGEAEQQSYLSMKIDNLLIFFSILMPEMTNFEEQILDEALIKTYARFGITNDNSTLVSSDNPERFKAMPVLGDLYDVLKDNPRAERISIILNRFVNGSASAFNQQTNVDLSNPYTVIDLTHLKKKLLSAGMFIALDLIWDRAKQNRIEQKAIIIDEVWQLIGADSNKLAAEFVVEIAKIGRAYNCSAIFATQDIQDFFALEDGRYGKAIINNSKTKLILNLEPQEAEKAGEVLNLTETEIHKIKNFERGYGLLSSNGNNIAVRMRSSEAELEAMTSDPEELSSQI